MPDLYVDASMPDDTGNGLTPATAKRTVRGARLIVADGDRVFVRAGQCHDPQAGAFFAAPNGGIAGLTIDAYGDGDRPIWDNLVYQNPGTAGWTHVSDGVWKRTFGNFFTRRIFAASRNNGFLISQRTVGPALRRAPIAGVTSTSQNVSEATIVAALSASNPWAPGGALAGWAVYVWTGSAVVSPPDFYDGLALLHADGASFGAVDLITLWNIENVLIQNQRFRGAGAAAIRISSQNDRARGVRNVLIQDCEATHIFQAAVRVQRVAQVSPTWDIRGVLVRRVVADYSTNANEQEVLPTEDGLSGVGDAFVADIGANEVRFERCRAINPFHIGFAIGAVFSNQQQSQNCSVADSTVEFSPWTTYSRGFCVYNGAGHVIERNTVIGQSIRSQFAGSVDVRSNRWIDCKPSIRKPDGGQVFGCEAYWYDGGVTTIGNDRYVQIWPTNVRIYNNYADMRAVAEDMVQLNSYNAVSAIATAVGPAQWPANSVTIANNVVVGTSTTAVLRATRFGGNAPTIPQPVVRNNCFVSSAPGLTNRVVWNGVSSGVNGAAGFSSNIEIDPRVSAAGRPLVGSPLLSAGVHLTYHRDAEGRQRPNPPSIGAYDGAVFGGYVA